MADLSKFGDQRTQDAIRGIAEALALGVEPADVINGVVVDADGNPIPGAPSEAEFSGLIDQVVNQGVDLRSIASQNEQTRQFGQLSQQGAGDGRNINVVASNPGGTQQAPATGLIGSEQALMGGLAGAGGALQQGLDFANQGIQNSAASAERLLREGVDFGADELRQGRDQALGQLQQGQIQQRQDAQNVFNQSSAPLQRFAQSGQNANNLQAAQSGALGPEAQAQAFANFNASPGQQFALEEAERASLRNAGATGGLGGGRVQQELQRQAIGFAQQDFGNQFDRLGQVSGAGLQAAGQIGGLGGQIGTQFLNNLNSSNLTGAGITNQTGQQLGSMGLSAGQTAGQGALQVGSQLSNLGTTGGVTGANLFQSTGNNLAAGRTNAGNAIANNIGGTSTALANLVNQQGIGTSDLLGQTGGNLAGILSGTGQNVAAGQQGLGSTLGNIAVGQASQAAGLPGVPGVQQSQDNTLGQIGQIAGGVGGLALAFSDKRMKTNITPIGQTAGGHNLYSWDWIDESMTAPTTGVIAQEAMEIQPEAVIMGEDGFYRVDYGSIK